MFTGIIEDIATIESLKKEGSNLHISIKSNIASELKIDQSVAHNGVCLTVVDIERDVYTVTAIEETLLKTNLQSVKIGDEVNIERAMKLGDRLDGHIVQGHIDQTGICLSKEEKDGSWVFTFEYNAEKNNITIEKGSITVNGVSLTVVDAKRNVFSVAIIPYTYENTNFQHILKGHKVNLEFDVIGKYVARLISL